MRSKATMMRTYITSLLLTLWSRRISPQFERIGSLSPRLSRVGLVHGAVLHVFPCLAQAVKTCPTRRDKSLKVVRVEVDGKKTLGVKFPDWKVGARRSDEALRISRLGAKRGARADRGVITHGRSGDGRRYPINVVANTSLVAA